MGAGSCDGNGAAVEIVGVSVSQEDGTSVPRRKGLSFDTKVLVLVGVPCVTLGVAYFYFLFKGASNTWNSFGEWKLERLKQCEGKHPRECEPLNGSIIFVDPLTVSGAKPHPDSMFLMMWEYSDGEYVEIRDNIVVRSGSRMELVFPPNDLR